MKYYSTILTCVFLLLSISCREHEEIEPIEPLAENTLLIYMIGDNTPLTGFCRTNIESIKKSLLMANDDINVVIYKDNKDKRPNGADLPVLFQLKKNYDKKTQTTKIDTIYIKEFDKDINSCSPQVISEIVSLTFSTFNSNIKGLEFWGHGGSWLPSSSYRNTKGTRWMGWDDQAPELGEQYIELWDLRESLEKCNNIHFDYIIFDECNMGTAEVAYELSNLCDFIAASPTEILDAGLPYYEIIQQLSVCKKSNIKQTMINIGTEYKNHYYDKGTFTIVETKNINKLVEKYKSIIDNNPEKLESIKNDASNIERKWQHFGGSSSTWYYLYDIQEIAEYLGGNIEEELSLCIPFHYFPPKSYVTNVGYKPITRFSGLAISVPELFDLGPNESTFSTYGRTKWGKYMGY